VAGVIPPGFVGRVTLTVPLATLLGLAGRPRPSRDLLSEQSGHAREGFALLCRLAASLRHAYVQSILS
jgi:hypothetical protein